MYGPNVGLEIGRRALLAQQLSLNLTGHNIANVNTPGFSRQDAIYSTTVPMESLFGHAGTGVHIDEIRRIRSVFLDQQYRSESHRLGKWQFLARTWHQIEGIYQEPDDIGMSAQLDKFWNAWQDLANNPESESARVALREQSSLLINSFHQLSTQLTDLRDSLDADITTLTSQINTTAEQIAELNDNIARAELTGHSANDLRDRRDHLVDQLSMWVNVGVLEQPSGSYTVLMGGMALVDGNSNLEIDMEVESTGSNVTHRLFFKGTGIDIMNPGGELEGILEARDHLVIDQQAELDLLAVSLVEEVNNLHCQGFGLNGETDIDFFDPDTTGADDIDLDYLILSDVNNIAASLNGEIGDNSNALSIAALRDKLLMRNGQATFNEYYSSLIGKVGVKSKEAQNHEANQLALLSQIDNSRESLSGVSLDEEMANMIQFQHAYEAAARVVSVMDSALNTVINEMGLGPY
jgi:flagellar hook-associated protein 1 FlgK